MGQISETDYGFKLFEKKLNNLILHRYNNNKSNTSGSEMSTFSADDLLPSLPVPNLDDTLNKYLESIKPFVNELEYANSEKIVENFKNNIGQKLHFYLIDRSKKKRNWLEEWWLDWAYLEWRYPIAPYINTCGYLVKPYEGTQLTNQFKRLNIDYQLAFASLNIVFYNHFFDELRNEKYPMQKSRSSYFSMYQFRNLFNTCRIPLKNKDKLVSNFKTAREGKCPTHCVVIYKNRFFKLDAYNKENELLNLGEIYDRLLSIKAKCKTNGIGVGALTADNRDEWAANREHLLSLDPKNSKNLELIESSLYVIALDDIETPDIDETAKLGLMSNPKNRFFDKSYQLILSKNGEVTSNIEHSAFDGMVSQSLTAYVLEKIKTTKYDLTKITSSFEKRAHLLTEPEELEISYDLRIENEIRKCVDLFNKSANSVELKTLILPNCDKETLKTYKVNPDTFSQMCMQLAYYQLHNKPAPTYETATTRAYYHGRTETVRSCSMEAYIWCKEMCKKDKSTRLTDKQLLELFKKACNKHDKLMNEARENSGCDRHLLGLKLIAQSLNLEVPEIFTDSSWKKSGGDGNFKISSSCVGYIDSVGGCLPFCTDGYTMIYCFASKGLTYSLASFKASTETNLDKMIDSLKQATLQVQKLHETSSKI